MKQKLLGVSLLLLLASGCKTPKVTAPVSEIENVFLDEFEVTAPRENPYRASADKDFDLIHTKLEVSLDYTKQYLYGKATLTLKPHFYPQYNLVLDAKQFDIKEVSLLKENGTKVPLLYTYDSLQLKIQLDSRYEAGQLIRLYVDYTAKPEERSAGGSAAISSDKGLYFINPLQTDSTKPVQVWTQGETESNSCWFPTLDKPNQKSTQEIYIRHDKKYISLSNGRLVSSVDNKDGTVTDYWKQDLPHAPYLFMMVIGDFAVVKETWRDIPVTYYVEKEYEPFARKIFGNTPEMMEFFSQKIGFDYPWAKYAQVVVRDYVSGAMENTSATLHSESLQRNSRELLDETYEDYVSHELFHQWFGDLVTCESWSNIPLNESFATYGEYLWAEYKYGKEEADRRWLENYEKYLQEAQMKNVDLVRFYYDDREDMFDRHSYEKGGLVLHYLRSIVGDEAFFKSLEIYLKNNQFKTVEVHQLRLAFEEVTGRDMNPFFNQWFLNSGHPVLDINSSFENDSVYLNITQRHNDSANLVYNLPMRVDLWFGNEAQSYNIELNQKAQTFSWKTDRKPDLVDADAQRVVLCEKTENKSMAEYVFQYNHALHFIQRQEAVKKLAEKQSEREDAKEIVRRALCDKSYIIRKLAVEELDLPADNAENIYSLLDSIAQDDKSSHVRKAAIEKLSESSWNTKYVSLFERMIGDSSYIVAAASLEALNDVNPARALEQAAHFQNERNVSMLLAVADVYATSGKEEHQHFFQQKLLTGTEAGKYSLVYYYANYLSKMEKRIVLNGISDIEQLAADKRNEYIRPACKGALKRISKLFGEKKKKVQAELDAATEADLKSVFTETVSNYEQIITKANEAVQRIGSK
jgi:aminopeptidase N